MKISAIIVTYDRPDALEAILRSLTGQYIKPDEVIIADDGSGRETAALISRYKTIVPFELKHIWHENKGFRAAAIRNKAIRESSGDYLVFSDGDLVFHPQFFYDFKQRITPGTAFIGSRVFLTPEASQKLVNDKQNVVHIFFYSRKIEANRLNAIRVPQICRLFPPLSYSFRLRGGLLGAWKSDIQAVNGWNESFTGWGLEDTELVARLFNHGITVRKLKFAGITYHLWHPVSNRENLTENRILLANTVNYNLTWSPDGLVKSERI